MLHLYLANKEARLSADTEITLKLTNEWFKDRETEHSYPFTLKLEANRHIFGFPERPGNHSLSRYMSLHGRTFSIVMPAFITYGGVTLLYGSARITSVNATEVELFCYSGEHDFWTALQRFRFGDLPEGISELFDVNISNNGEAMSSETLVSKFASFVSGSAMCFNQIYDPTMTSIPGETANIYPYLLNPRSGPFLTPTLDNKHCVFLPCPSMAKIMEIILGLAGYTIKFSSLAQEGNIFPYIHIISRRKYISLAHYTPQSIYSIRLTDYLPKITFREFIEEIERKFCVLFQLSQPSYSLSNNKTINIVSFDDYTSALPLDVEVLDGCEKEVLENDDIVAGYRFKDDEQADDAFNGEIMDVEPLSLESELSEEPLYDDTDGVKSIESISTPLAKYFDDVQGNYKGHAVIAAGDTGNIDINNEEEFSGGEIQSRYNEFRISLYKGYEFTPKFSSKEGLEWTQLREAYREKYKFLNSQFMTVEFVLRHPIVMLSKINTLFIRPIIVRNIRYLVIEQNISFKDSNIEFRIKCYPMP